MNFDWCIHFLECDWDAAIPRWYYHRGKFPLLYALFKKSWKKAWAFLLFCIEEHCSLGENIPILRYMGKKNDVFTWVKRSQVINFYVHVLLPHIESIGNWTKSMKGDMKNNLLTLLWFSEIFSLNSTSSTLFEPHSWAATSLACWLLK